MTRLINECLDDPEGYHSLLMNYGIWARYFGCKGYHSEPVSREEAIIDDDSALIVDKAMSNLKKQDHDMCSMISLFYIHGLSVTAIMSNVKFNRKWAKTHFNESFVNVMRYTSYEVFLLFLERSESVLRELIRSCQ